MTDQTPPPPPGAPVELGKPADAVPPPPPPPPTAYPPAPPVAPPYGAPVPMGPGPIGKVRGTGLCVLLFIVTLGFYSWYWWYSTHEEMKRHTGNGIGGVVGILLAIFISPVAAFFTSDEVGKMQELSGRPKTVSALTGLWYFPGMFLIFLPIVWFVKTNGALNDYWKSMGAPA